jgi:hypothetical protein
MDVETLALVVFLTLVTPAAWMFMVPIAKPLRREAERPSELPSGVVAGLDRLNARLAEGEERVDFTERLPARQRDPGRPTGDRT